MTSTEFAAYCRRIRLTDDPARLAAIRSELDREHPHNTESTDSDAPVLMATLKRVQIIESA